MADRQTKVRGFRVGGHPVHAMMSDVPLAFFLMSVVVDGIALARGVAFWWAASFWTVVVGVVAAVPTACAGLIDYATIVPKLGANRTATVHMLVMLTAIACFGIDLLLRGGGAIPQRAVLVAALVLDVGGAAVVGVGAWFGGELVFGHGVGVRKQLDEANREAQPKIG